MAPGTSVAFGVQVQPCMGLVSFLVERDEIEVMVDGEILPETGRGTMHSMVEGHASSPPPPTAQENLSVPLHPDAARRGPPPRAGEDLTVEHLAYTRSGEKGETINIGVIARKPDHLPLLRATLTEATLKVHLPDLGDFRVTVYEVPGIHALNLVLDGALPGGLNASQRLDPAAKSIGQRVLGIRV